MDDNEPYRIVNSDEEIEVEEMTEQEIEEALLPAPVQEAEDGGDTVQYLLTPEQREELLGKLAEFEVRLLEVTPMMRAFCLAYLADPTNASVACRKAGYTEHSCRTMASKLLSNPKISAIIALGCQLREDRTRVTSDRTINELALIAYSDIAHYRVKEGNNQVETVEGVPSYATRAIASAEFTVTTQEDDDGKVKTTHKTRIKLWPKTEALRMLAMYQKLLNPEGGTTINNDNRGQVHNYQSNRWSIGGKEIEF